MNHTHTHVRGLDGVVSALKGDVKALKDAAEADKDLMVAQRKATVASERQRLKHLLLRGITDELENQAAMNRLRIIGGDSFVPPTSRDKCTFAELAKVHAPDDDDADDDEAADAEEASHRKAAAAAQAAADADKQASQAIIASWYGVPLEPRDGADNEERKAHKKVAKAVIRAYYAARRDNGNASAHPVIAPDVTVNHLLLLAKLVSVLDTQLLELLSAWVTMHDAVVAGTVGPPLPVETKRDALTVTDIDHLAELAVASDGADVCIEAELTAFYELHKGRTAAG